MHFLNKEAAVIFRMQLFGREGGRTGWAARINENHCVGLPAFGHRQMRGFMRVMLALCRRSEMRADTATCSPRDVAPTLYRSADFVENSEYTCVCVCESRPVFWTNNISCVCVGTHVSNCASRTGLCSACTQFDRMFRLLVRSNVNIAAERHQQHYARMHLRSGMYF